MPQSFEAGWSLSSMTVDRTHRPRSSTEFCSVCWRCGRVTFICRDTRFTAGREGRCGTGSRELPPAEVLLAGSLGTPRWPLQCHRLVRVLPTGVPGTARVCPVCLIFAVTLWKSPAALRLPPPPRGQRPGAVCPQHAGPECRVGVTPRLCGSWVPLLGGQCAEQLLTALDGCAVSPPKATCS